MAANVLIVFEIELDIAKILLDEQFSQLFKSILFSDSEGFKLEPEMTGQGFPFVWLCRYPCKSCNIGKIFSIWIRKAAI
jgi:hypothetical protein